MPMTRLAPSDQPADAIEVETFERPEQGFGGNEPNCGIDLSESVCSLDKPPVLDGNAHPDIRVPLELRGKLREAPVPLGENLKDMLGSASHYVEYSADEIERNLLMKEVAH
jgi:hypothetical protein